MVPADGESIQPAAPAAGAVPAAISASHDVQHRTIGTASTFTFLQALVTVALSYQLLFSPNTVFDIEILEFVVLALLVIVIIVMALPHHLWRTRLVVWSAIIGNTLLCANVMYMAGLDDPGLYITLGVLVLVAVFAPSVNLHASLSVGLIAAYAIVWNFTAGRDEALSEGNILQFVVLFVMANFYWYILGMRTLEPVKPAAT